MSTILIVHATRKNRMQLLESYIEKLYKTHVIDQVHVWDSSAKKEDEIWFKDRFSSSIQKPKTTLPTTPPLEEKQAKKPEFEKKYNTPKPVEEDISVPFLFVSSSTDNSHKLFDSDLSSSQYSLWVKARSDVHVLVEFHNEQRIFEIVIGGWNNSKSVLRESIQGSAVASVERHGILTGDTFQQMDIELKDNFLFVKWCNQILFKYAFQSDNKIKQISVHTGCGYGGEWMKQKYVESPQPKSIQIDVPIQKKNETMEPSMYFRMKSVIDLFQYYDAFKDSFPKSTSFVKIDDRVTFIDLPSFGEFIKYRKRSPLRPLLIPTIVSVHPDVKLKAASEQIMALPVTAKSITSGVHDKNSGRFSSVCVAWNGFDIFSLVNAEKDERVIPDFDTIFTVYLPLMMQKPILQFSACIVAMLNHFVSEKDGLFDVYHKLVLQ